MIIVRLMGGLGNQLFQYASARGLAALRGAELKLDATHYAGPQRPPGLEAFSRALKLHQFEIADPEATPAEIAAVKDRRRRWTIERYAWGVARRLCSAWAGGDFRERKPWYDPAFLKLPDNTYVSGYLQSERYFQHIAKELRQAFTLRDQTIAAKADDVARRARAANPGRPLVAVHVRRGDLAHALEVLKAPALIYGPPVSEAYLERAMACFPSDSVFMVFSESARDFAWCRERIRAPHAVFCEGASDLEDFTLMQRCDHVIMSNSTFSWWAAWLNPNPGKRVIAPRNWFWPSIYPESHFRDLIPEPWELL